MNLFLPDKYCGLCGGLLLKDNTPLAFVNTPNFMENDLDQGICVYCKNQKVKPFLWIGQLPGYYVTPCGRIFKENFKKELNPYIDSHGYKCIKIYLGEKERDKKYPHKRIALRVHKMVILAYKRFDYYQNLLIRHLDDNKMNNHYNNLVWGTHKENKNDYKKNKGKRNV